MKYNSIENAEVFIKEQIEWALGNGYQNFTIYSNGEELRALIDNKDIALIFAKLDLEREGYWKAVQFVNGHRVEY